MTIPLQTRKLAIEIFPKYFEYSYNRNIKNHPQSKLKAIDTFRVYLTNYRVHKIQPDFLFNLLSLLKTVVREYPEQLPALNQAPEIIIQLQAVVTFKKDNITAPKPA